MSFFVILISWQLVRKETLGKVSNLNWFLLIMAIVLVVVVVIWTGVGARDAIEYEKKTNIAFSKEHEKSCQMYLFPIPYFYMTALCDKVCMK